jgi:hypothetical protein
MAREIKEQTSNVVLYTDGCMLIKGVRASYPHLGKPKRVDDDDPESPKKFSMTGLADKKTHGDVLKMCVKRIDAILAERNDGKKIPADKKFAKDGDLKAKDEYDGMWALSASEVEEKPPILRDARNRTVKPEDAARVFFAGGIVNMLIKPWWQDNKHGKRVNASLLAVQFVKDDGVSFGEERISEEDADEAFESYEDGGESSGFDEDDDSGL